MVQDALNELKEMCDDAKSGHGHLLGLMLYDEQEKQEIQFKAKLLFLNECITIAEMWVLNLEGNLQENVDVANEGDPNQKLVGINQIDDITNSERNPPTMKEIHKQQLLWMILTRMAAFLMWQANAQVKEALTVEDHAPPLHA